jgi:anthranilate phosphoribosyltransferase
MTSITSLSLQQQQQQSQLVIVQPSLTFAIEKLLKHQHLSSEDVDTFLKVIATGQADPVQVSAVLVLLRSKKESGEELAAFASNLRRQAIRPVLSQEHYKSPLLCDIVGTGGDGHDTVNISTAAAIVASACGCRVAKHGNRSASSLTGSSDVLEKLGIPMLSPDMVGKCLEKCGITFMMAPLFHPALANVGAVRKSLGVRTIFNILGPLINPIEPKRMVLGVYLPELIETYADAVMALGAEHAMIVHCHGLDELAPLGNAKFARVRNGTHSIEMFSPSELNIPVCKISDLKGGDAIANAQLIRQIFAGGDEILTSHIARTIALNAAAVLQVCDLVPDLASGYRRALDCLVKGDALKKLNEWSEVAQGLKKEEEVKRTKMG